MKNNSNNLSTNSIKEKKNLLIKVTLHKYKRREIHKNRHRYHKNQIKKLLLIKNLTTCSKKSHRKNIKNPKKQIGHQYKQIISTIIMILYKRKKSKTDKISSDTAYNETL